MTLKEDTTYQNNKEYDKESDVGTYEEVKFGDYSGYIVKGDFDIDGYILLEDL